MPAPTRSSDAGPGPGSRAPLAELRELAAAYSRSPGAPRRIAVVGNAPLAPSEERADAVDTADLVVRVNSFVTDLSTPERAQGRHTDVVLWSRLVKATPDFFRGYRDRLYVLLEPMRMFGRQELWPSCWPADLGFAVARNDEVAVPLCQDLGLPWREQRLAPTTGTTAVWLAARLFPDAELLVAGLSFLDRPEQTEWHHQWGDAVRVGPEHRIGPEGEMLRRWRDEGRITFLPPGQEGEQ